MGGGVVRARGFPAEGIYYLRGGGRFCGDVNGVYSDFACLLKLYILRCDTL